MQGRIADTDDEEEDVGIMLLMMHEWDKFFYDRQISIFDFALTRN